MTTPKRVDDPFENFVETQLQELLEIPDAEILEGEDPAALKKEALKLLEVAKAEAGRRRLQAARTRMESKHADSPDVAPDVSVADARAYIVRAANDPRFTLAARGLDEMSEDDLLRLYRQIRYLETAGDNDLSDDE